jgi:hypothetical protein
MMWVVVVGLAATVHADTSAEATRFFEDGLALQEAGKHVEACAKFARSYALDRQASRPAPGTQLNLGDCAEREGQLRKAYLLFDDAARAYELRGRTADAKLATDPAAADARRESERAAAGVKLARERADAIAPRLAKVRLRMANARIDGLAVRIADRAIPPAEDITEVLDAGDVAITVSAPGHQPFTTTAKAESGKLVVVEIPALEAEAVDGDDRVGPGPVGGKRKPSRVRLALGLGAGGVVMLAVSGTLAVLANSQYADGERACPNLVCADDAAGQAGFDNIESAGKKADLATYTGIAGGLLAVSAAVVYFTAPREQITVTPVATSSTAGISLFGRF